MSTPISRLKSEARKLSRAEGIPLHEALDRIARREGFATWSLLSSQDRRPDDVGVVLRGIDEGDMVLVAARPGHGKTRLCLELVGRALGQGARCAVFSFELTRAQLVRHFGALSVELEAHQERFHFDNSDEIHAGSISSALEDAAPGTWVVVDYLQLLDQRRSNPPVQEQVTELARVARERRLRMLLISQIDKRFEEEDAREMPGLADVRMPNPVDLGVFTKSCFLHRGQLVFGSVGAQAVDA